MTSNNFLNYEEGYGKTFHIPRTLVWDWQVVSVGWRIWAGKIRSMAEYNGLCIPVRPPRTQVHITTWLLLVRLLFSWSVVPKSLRPHGLQHARPSCPSLSPGVLLKLMSIELMMPSNHFILCHPFLLLPSIFPSKRVFFSELAFGTKWPKYCSFSFSISSSNEYSVLISFRIDWFDLLAVQGTLGNFL